MTNKSKSSKKISTKQLVTAALFIALALVVKPFEIYILPVARFNFVAVPAIMAAIMLGPWWGAGVAFIVDLLGFMIMDKSGMALNPIVTLANVMIAFLPGVVFAVSKKQENVKKLKYNILNVVCYLVLLVLVIALLVANGTMFFENRTLFIISPSSGAPSEVSWLIVGIVGAAFIVYSVIVIMLVTKNPEKESSRNIMPKLLFGVTTGMIIGDIIISGLGLGLQYGWPLPLMLVVRIIKAFFAIPIYTLLCYIIYKAVGKNRI